MKLKYLSAPIYQNLLPSEILSLSVPETRATCGHCLMSRSPIPRAERYEENLKCCTYYPFLPNFAVGAVLANESARYEMAKTTLRSFIEQRRYSLPIGMLAPIRYQLEFKKRKKGDFGQREDWLCPYYNKGENQCSLWAYRGAVCTSFYCRSSFGSAGKKYWEQMSDYLSYVEMALMEEALIRLDFSPRQISQNLTYLNREEGTVQETRSWSLPKKRAMLLWRDYFSDQEGFFIKCFELVRTFAKKDFGEMMGEQGMVLTDKLLKQYGKVHERA